MNKFKPGDKVVCIVDTYESIDFGQSAIVLEYEFPPDVYGSMSLVGLWGEKCVYDDEDFVNEEFFNSPLNKALRE